MTAAKYKSHPIADLFPLMTGMEYDELVESIRDHGLRDPIILLKGMILDGRNRLRACGDAGVEPRFKELSEKLDPWTYVWDKNAVRRHLQPGQRAAIYLDFEEGTETWAREHGEVQAEANVSRSEKAKGNQNASKKQTRLSGAATVSPRGKANKTGHERQAKKASVSPATLKRALALKKDAPDLFDALRAGTMTLSKANDAFKRRKVRAVAARIDAAPPPLPDTQYAVIAADPSWKFDKRDSDDTHRGRASVQYPPMTVDQIKALPVSKLAAPDCVLWLWAPNAFILDGTAADVAKVWGFEPKALLTWAKDRLGTGDYLRNQTEQCIMAVRGRPVITLTNESTLLPAQVREHSRKPEEFYRLVEKLCHGAKLEMFAREPRKGWVAWGAETQKFAPPPTPTDPVVMTRY